MKRKMSFITIVFVITVILQQTIHETSADTVYDLPTRLVHGSRESEGTIQVYIDGQWGTVCSSYFQAKEARVVCRMLGYSGNVVWPAINSHYGLVDGPSWIQGLDCVGNETSLMQCSYAPLASRLDCPSRRSAGVDCEPDTSHIPLRLSGNANNTDGRVEIFHEGRWGTVCGYGWGAKDAAVVCRQLGFNGATPVPILKHQGGTGSYPIVVGWMECNGDENNLGLCSHRPWGNMECLSNVAGVKCLTGDPEILNPHNFNVRLVGESAPNKGRLEIQYLGLWGAMCDLQWSAKEDTAVCKMLGYQWGGEYKASASRSYNWASIVICKGGETTINDCTINHPYLDSRCSPFDTIGLICRNDTPPTYPVMEKNPRVPILNQSFAVTCTANGGSIDLTTTLYAGRAGWPFSKNSRGRQPSSTIRFDRLGPEHNGLRFSCLALSFEFDWAQFTDTDITLNIKFPPDTVTLEVSSAIELGSVVTLTCMTSEANPAPTLLWFLGQNHLPSSSDVFLRPGQNHGFLAYQNTTIRVIQEMIGQTIKCMAFHESTIFPKTASISLM